jgi:hypothetical protein
MTPKVQVGTISDRGAAPDRLGSWVGKRALLRKLERDHVIKGLDGFSLDRKIHTAGWSFFFIATEVKVMIFGAIWRSNEHPQRIEADLLRIDKRSASMATTFTPLHDCILVRRVEEAATTRGGILIPDSAKDKPQEGEVISVGKGKSDEDGKVFPLAVKKGGPHPVR